MANTTIKLKKSGTSGNTPSTLEFGELSLNYADGKLYYKNDSGVIAYISSGASTNSFATINANSGLIFATSNTDILSLAGANNITITSDSIYKTITIGARLSDSLYSNSSVIGATANAVANVYNQLLAERDIITAVSTEAFLAYNTANNAYNQANVATSLAQSAYNYANTIAGGGETTTYFNYLTVQKQLYTANASQTNFFVNYTAPYVTVVVNGATIDSSEYSTSTANTVILNNAASVGDVVDITGFYQANSATITAGGGSGTDQWVRDTANSAVANTIVTQGVDATQNIRLNAIETNNINQNTSISIIQGVDLGQNTRITEVNQFAQSAYNQANTATSLEGAVRYDVEQTLSGTQQTQAISNLGLQTVASTGNYDDLTGKPVISSGQLTYNAADIQEFNQDLSAIGAAFDYNGQNFANQGILRRGYDLNGYIPSYTVGGITSQEIEDALGYIPPNPSSLSGTNTGDETTSSIVTKLSTATSISDSSGNVRSIPQNSRTSAYTLIASDNGKHIATTSGGVTVPANVFAAGNSVMIVNNSASNQFITQGSGLTLRWAGQASATTGGRTIGLYGIATILFISPTVAFISGAGVS